MKVMFAGDWHADPLCAWAAVREAVEQGVTHIIHVGDFFFTGYEGNNFLNSMERALRRYGIVLTFVRGNHDDTNALRRFEVKAHDNGTLTPEGFVPMRPRVFWAPDGLTWEWEGAIFGSLGGAPSIDRGHRVLNKTWWADEETSDKAVDKIIAAGKVDILVMHDVPLNVILRTLYKQGTGLENRARLQRAVDAVRPSWTFSGHYHSFQMEPVTYSDGSKGTSVILDRGDYSFQQDNPARLARNLFTLEVADGKAEQVRESAFSF